MLTNGEKRVFDRLAANIKRLFKLSVDIVPLNHREHIPMANDEEVLGCCHKILDNNGNLVDYLITIDIPYIRSCLYGMPYSPYNIDMLVETICHEIAHLYIWQHGSEHTALTKELHNIARRAL